MTWFPDLTECPYFPVRVPALRAIGWLERGKAFPIGGVEPEVYAALLELSKNPWQPMVTLGWHDCDLCQYEVTARSCANVFVPGREVIYVCPELTTHYMNAHGYMPPEEFCQAVLACPPMGSRAYLSAILSNGGRLLVQESRRGPSHRASRPPSPSRVLSER
jgi:hypothetical protein